MSRLAGGAFFRKVSEPSDANFRNVTPDERTSLVKMPPLDEACQAGKKGSDPDMASSRRNKHLHAIDSSGLLVLVHLDPSTHNLVEQD